MEYGGSMQQYPNGSYDQNPSNMYDQNPGQNPQFQEPLSGNMKSMMPNMGGPGFGGYQQQNQNFNNNYQQNYRPQMKMDLYKTSLCKTWEAQGSCSYGDRCKFAHGQEDIRAPGSFNGDSPRYFNNNWRGDQNRGRGGFNRGRGYNRGRGGNYGNNMRGGYGNNNMRGGYGNNNMRGGYGNNMRGGYGNNNMGGENMEQL